MESLGLYLLKMIVCSGVLFAYYLLFLKDKTFHHYNRFYLLFTVIVSLLLPLIKVSYFTIELNPDFYLLLNQFNSKSTGKSQNYDIDYYTIFYTLVGVVSVFLLIRLILGLIRIQHIKKQFPNEVYEGINFYQTNLENAPFSFFRNLFWKQSLEINSLVGKQILKHEMVHIEQKHSWDKMMLQLIKSIFWFNPIFYIINSEINLIHEYLADNKAVKKSDTKAFAQMLLESHFSGQILPATSPFLSSNLKKRLKMLTKSKTKYSYARKLFALPILFVVVFAYLVNAKNKEILETNKTIENAINEIKKDTIKPIKPDLDNLSTGNQEQIGIYSDGWQEDQSKINDIGRKMANKSKELSALKKAKKENTPAFKSLENEMLTLSNQMEDIVKSENYQKNLRILESSAKGVDAQEWSNKFADVDKITKDIERKVNSPAFRKRIADAEKASTEAEAKINSPEFKKMMADAERRSVEIASKINSPEFKLRIAEAKKGSAEAEALLNSPEFKKKLEDANIQFSIISPEYGLGYAYQEVPKYVTEFNYQEIPDDLTPKQKRQLEKKKKDFLKKKGEYEKARKELLGNPVIGILDKDSNAFSNQVTKIKYAEASPSSQITKIKYAEASPISKNFVLTRDDKMEIRYFLNEKEISKDDFDTIKPNTIKRIDVNKSNSQNVIKIQTK